MRLTNIETPYPVMDESGKVREWLDSGRGLRVWESRDIGAGRPDMLTPGDVTTPPHWAYPAEASCVLGLAEVAFFRRVSVLQSWSDTLAGWKAAERYLGHMSIAEKNLDEQVPIGRKLTRYTVERFTLESDIKVHMPGHPGRPPAIPATEPYDRPLHTESRVGVVLWVCIIPKEGAAR